MKRFDTDWVSNNRGHRDRFVFRTYKEPFKHSSKKTHSKYKVEESPEQIFLQREYSGDKWALGNSFTITALREMQSKTRMM